MSVPIWWSRTITEGDFGRDVAVAQRKLGLLPTGHADPSLPLVVRGYQKALGLPTSGLIDAATAAQMGELEGFGLLPVWWTGPATRPEDPEYPHALSLIGATGIDGMKRFQGNHHLPPTGLIDETTARLLAGLEVELW